jgi:hypothetical protein
MGRSPCCDKTKVKRGPWSQEEDAVLRSFVERFGNAGNWIALPQRAGDCASESYYCFSFFSFRFFTEQHRSLSA